MSGSPSNASPGAPGGNSIRPGQGYRLLHGSASRRAGRGGRFGRDVTYLGVSADDVPQVQQEHHHQADTPVIQQSLEERRQTGHSALVINVEGNATIRIDLERKEETRQRQAEEALGGDQQSPEEDTAMGNGSRRAATTPIPKASSGEGVTLKQMAESMAQIQHQMKQMQQQLSAVQAYVEPAPPPRSVQERSGNTRYSPRLTRGSPEHRPYRRGPPVNRFEPLAPPKFQAATVSASPTSQATFEEQIAFADSVSDITQW
ncbi:unnamed protein product [Clonostachys byssicola]|uniref:Uncharacterized protein n=1 Tax=Clonostachys byssicola TaxID=160290 RepID=A0A9N9UJ41_9HYPO|nr:unnamed protein product [Clonostachys byssicola]